LEVLEGDSSLTARAELMRLRKRVHLQACELQWKRSELDMAQRKLRQAQQAHDELRLKHSNLERIEQKTSGSLLVERRKNDELSRQVAAESQNLMNICSSLETGGGQQQASGMQKQCFRLVQQNTALTVQYGLLRRQKGWAEAKARVLESEVANVYIKKTAGNKEEQPALSPKANAGSDDDLIIEDERGTEGPYRMLLPLTGYRNKDVVRDFLTQLMRSSGRDAQSFLQGPRVTSEAIRNDCLKALSHEFYGLWRITRTLPEVLHSAERVVHLGEYLEVFEGVAGEIMALLGCTGARMWMVDYLRDTMWTCYRGTGNLPVTQSCPLAKSQDPQDLAGKGLAAAACATEALVTVLDAWQDPRYCEACDSGGVGPVRSMLCVPIMRSGKSNKVVIVLQAMNKLLQPRFDADFDAEVLRLIGRVAREVSEVCEASGGNRANTKRKEVLLQILAEHLPCADPGLLLHALETGLQKLFKAQAVALHVLNRRSSSAASRSSLSSRSEMSKLPGVGSIRRNGPVEPPSTAQATAPRRLLRVAREGLRGVVGHVNKTQVAASYSLTQLEDSMYDAMSDLPVPDGMLHTVPICEDGHCSAICQFVCPDVEAKQRFMLVSEGCYNAENQEHRGFTADGQHQMEEASAPPPDLREAAPVHLRPAHVLRSRGRGSGVRAAGGGRRRRRRRPRV